MKKIVFLFVFLSAIQSYAINDSVQDSVSTSLNDKMQGGKFEFHARSFFMNTINKGQLSDYYVLAKGAGLAYDSKTWKGFGFGISGFFTFSVFQNNLDIKDPITNAPNRYELLLFDMNQPDNKKDLNRMDELFVKYQRKKLNLIFGRQKVKSPLMNEQDNRMRPNIFSGISGKYSFENSKIHLGLFNALAPRGTVDWYKIKDSFGVYPFGRNVFGIPSDYKGNVKTKGIALLGFENKKRDNHFQLWNYYADNIFNLFFFQNDIEKHLKQNKLVFGLQGFFQTAINHGGNEDMHKTYITKGEKTYALGARSGIKQKQHFLSLNYMHISNNGRFLFPREWGREQFYVSLPRERLEGSGGVNSYVIKHEYNFKNKHLKSVLGAGYSSMSSLENYFLNKYGMPSYYHFVGSLTYKAKGFLEGMDILLLAAHKIAQKPIQVPNEFRINRVDLWNFSIVADYKF
jgi:hypothetical protein